MKNNIISLIQSQNTIKQKHTVPLSDFITLCKMCKTNEFISLSLSKEGELPPSKEKYFHSIKLLGDFHMPFGERVEAIISFMQSLVQYQDSIDIDVKYIKGEFYAAKVDGAKISFFAPISQVVTWLVDTKVNNEFKKELCTQSFNDECNTISTLPIEVLDKLKHQFDSSFKLDFIFDFENEAVIYDSGNFYKDLNEAIKKTRMPEILISAYKEHNKNMPTHIMPLFNDILDLAVDENYEYQFDLNEVHISILLLNELIEKYVKQHSSIDIEFLKDDGLANQKAIVFIDDNQLGVKIAHKTLLSHSLTFKNEPQNDNLLLKKLKNSDLNTYLYLIFVITDNGCELQTTSPQPSSVILTDDVLSQLDYKNQKDMLEKMVQMIHNEYDNENPLTIDSFVNEFLPQFGFINSDNRQWLNILVKDSQNKKTPGFMPFTENKIKTVSEMKIINLELDEDLNSEYDELNSNTIFLTI